MSNAWKVRLDGVLREGEVVGLYFTTAMLVVVEFCFVYWLHRIQIPEAPGKAASGFIVMPPWYQKPRFEVTLLLTVLAGLLFSVCWGLWNLWRKRTDTKSWETAVQLVKQRVRTTTSVAALTGVELARHLASRLNLCTHHDPVPPNAASLERHNHDSRFLSG